MCCEPNMVEFQGPGSDDPALRAAIVAAIKTVYDPEIPVDIWELGLIYEIRMAEDTQVEILMTLTSPMCPVAGSLPFEVQERVREVEGVAAAEVELTFDPPWTKERMSDEARVALDFF